MTLYLFAWRRSSTPNIFLHLFGIIFPCNQNKALLQHKDDSHTQQHVVLMCNLGRDRLAILMDEWLSCDGHWTESSLYKQLRHESRFRKLGRRKWLTLSEMSLKFGSTTVAERIRDHKMRPELVKTQVRDNPDCPGVEDTWVYLIHHAWCDNKKHVVQNNALIIAVLCKVPLLKKVDTLTSR